MDAATLQNRIYSGYGKAAKRIGYAFGVYRPTSATANPIQPGNLITTLLATFTVSGIGFNFEKPSAYKNPLFNGLFDATLVLPGDYMVNATHGTYFVASLPDQVPPLCVQCDRVISIKAPGPAKTFGAQTAYSGSTLANEVAVMSLYPASILLDARGRSTEVALPMDLPAPFFQILLPAIAGVDVRSGMAISDDQGRRYIISAAENSFLGWRISAQQAVT